MTDIINLRNPRAFKDADFRAMVDGIADYAIFFLDASGCIQTWNYGAHCLKGYTEQEIIGRHFSIFYPDEMLHKNWPEYELQMARERGRFEDEGWRLRKDGTRFWASVIITRLTDDHGNLRGFSKITRDLTERRKQEEALRNSEERFRLLVEGVNDYAIFMLDPGGFIVSWNSGARLSTGYEADEIIGKHFSIFYPVDAIAKDWPAEELKRAIAEGRYEEEGWRLRKDGTRYWADVVITSLKDRLGNHRGFAKVTRDLTEKRRVTVLENEGRRITAFITMLAHELRNPLAPIGNAVALLELEDSPTPRIELARSIISRQQKQLSRLVDDLLDISRITVGRIHLEKRPVCITQILEEAAATIAPLCAEKHQHLDMRLKDANVWVLGDRMRLIQIFTNLLHNAMKFTPEKGGIVISAESCAASVKITVKDNGCGINPGRLPQLFVRFEQRDDDETKTAGGLGLGLSLVHHLVTLQNGTVTASSAGNPGLGSEFTVQFPVVTSIADEKKLNVHCRGSILIVDDNRDAANSMAMLLENEGYSTSTVYCGNDAIAAIKSTYPQVVMLDIGLPDLDGIEVLNALRAEDIHLPPVIAVTGYGMELDRERSFKAGFHAHLTKPVEPRRVLAIIKSILDE